MVKGKHTGKNRKAEFKVIEPFSEDFALPEPETRFSMLEKWINRRASQNCELDLKLETVFRVGPKGQETRFALNKFTLKLSSPEFRRILDSETPGDKFDGFPEVSPKAFAALMEYIFVMEPWKFTSLEDAFALVDVAGRFQIQGLLQEILQYLYDQMLTKRLDLFQVDSVCQFYSLLRKYDLEGRKLTRAAQEFILRNASTIFEQDMFFDFSHDDLQGILSKDDLKVESELQVFKALLRWALNFLKLEGKLCESEILRDTLSPLIRWIRFPNLDQSEFRHYVQPLGVLSKMRVNWMNEYWENSKKVNGSSYPVFSSSARMYTSPLTSSDLQLSSQERNMKTLELKQELMQLQILISNYNVQTMRRINDELRHQIQDQHQEFLRSCRDLVAQEREQNEKKLQQLKIISRVNLKRSVLNEMFNCQMKGNQYYRYGSSLWTLGIILENSSNSDLLTALDSVSNSGVIKFPTEIPSQSTKTFTGSISSGQIGYFAYKIKGITFAVRYSWNGSKPAFVLAFMNCKQDFCLTELQRGFDGAATSGLPTTQCVSVEPVQYNVTDENPEKKMVEISYKNFQASAAITMGQRSLMEIVISDKAADAAVVDILDKGAD